MEHESAYGVRENLAMATGQPYLLFVFFNPAHTLYGE